MCLRTWPFVILITFCAIFLALSPCLLPPIWAQPPVNSEPRLLIELKSGCLAVNQNIP